jgi:alkane 1-monooxygenase
MRIRNNSGNYEKLGGHHAWSAGRHNTTVDLFHLENHSHHHMQPNLSFEKLTVKQDAPQHPAGYSFMVLLTLVPPLWFKIMNKRIPSHLLKTHS